MAAAAESELNRRAETNHRPPATKLLRMIITSTILSWLGLALLFTIAVCRAAARPTPKPGITDAFNFSPF
jgi:hypothetical protein